MDGRGVEGTRKISSQKNHTMKPYVCVSLSFCITFFNYMHVWICLRVLREQFTVLPFTEGNSARRRVHEKCSHLEIIRSHPFIRYCPSRYFFVLPLFDLANIAAQHSANIVSSPPLQSAFALKSSNEYKENIIE